MLVAMARGLHREWHARPWVIDDPYALPLVGPAWPQLLALYDAIVPRHLFELAFGAIAVRSRYAEDRLEMGSFSQYVLLGAGMDSLAWRRPDLLRQLTIFELDHPSTQAWKRERAALLSLPENERHVFAPVDFETEDLRDVLDRAGFDWGKPTLFNWLGVVMYLTREAMTTTLRTLAGAGPGSGCPWHRPARRSWSPDRSSVPSRRPTDPRGCVRHRAPTPAIAVRPRTLRPP